LADLVALVLIASAVVLPIAIGVAKGHVPRQALATWAFPLAGVTFLLALGVHGVERHLDRVSRLAIALLFAFAWAVAGAYTAFVQPRRLKELPLEVRQGIRTVGLLFLGFSGIWGAVALAKYFRG
jgi:hypothetical protein